MAEQFTLTFCGPKSYCSPLSVSVSPDRLHRRATVRGGTSHPSIISTALKSVILYLMSVMGS